VSALSLAVRKSVVGLTRMVQIAAAMFGGTLILFGMSHTLWLSLLLMLFVGFGMMQVFSASNTISLLAGTLAHRIGAPHTVILTGVFCVASALWFTLELPKVNAVIRPIYQEMGLLPASDVPSSDLPTSGLPTSSMDLISDEQEPAIYGFVKEPHSQPTGNPQ
jgi:hypothetical protein